MSNKRMITGDLFEDDISSEDYFTRLLWIGIIVATADDQGRLIDNPAIMKARIFPFDNNISDQQINNSLSKIGKSIYRYSANGKNLIQIVKWWKYQTPSWAAESKYPAPDGWIDRVKVHVAGNEVRTFNWDKVGGFVDNIVPTGVRTHVDRALNECDCEGDVKSDCEGDGECEPDTLVSPVQRMLEKATGMMPQGFNDAKALDEIEALKPTIEDVQAGVEWLKGQGKVVRYYRSLVGPIRTAIAERVQASMPVQVRGNSTAAIQSRNKQVIDEILKEANDGNT